MAKQRKTRLELERLILDELRRAPNCGAFGFIRIRIRPIAETRPDSIANWEPESCDYGSAHVHDCDNAMRDVIPRLQDQYELADE